jgi:hypothetical protein
VRGSLGAATAFVTAPRPAATDSCICTKQVHLPAIIWDICPMGTAAAVRNHSCMLISHPRADMCAAARVLLWLLLPQVPGCEGCAWRVEAGRAGLPRRAPGHSYARQRLV